MKGQILKRQKETTGNLKLTLSKNNNFKKAYPDKTKMSPSDMHYRKLLQMRYSGKKKVSQIQ